MQERVQHKPWKLQWGWSLNPIRAPVLWVAFSTTGSWKAVPLLGNVETLLKKPNVADDFHFLREGRLRAGGTLRKLLTWKVRRWWNCHILLNEVRLQHDLCVHVESCAIYSLGNQFHFVPPWSVVVPPKSNQHLVYLLGFVLSRGVDLYFLSKSF